MFYATDCWVREGSSLLDLMTYNVWRILIDEEGF